MLRISANYFRFFVPAITSIIVFSTKPQERLQNDLVCVEWDVKS